MRRALCRFLCHVCLLCSFVSFGIVAGHSSSFLLADDDGAPVPVSCTVTSACPTGSTGICSSTPTGFVCGETGPGKTDCKRCENRTVNNQKTCACEK